MVFSSILFLFLFLPIVMLVYAVFFLPSLAAKGRGKRALLETSNLWLLLSSLFFYAWGEKHLLLLILASTAIDYLAGLAITGGLRSKEILRLDKGRPRTQRQKWSLALSIVANLALLGYFKYFNFGIDSFNSLVASVGFESLAFEDVLRVSLPLGISFYTFQSMSYTIDVYRGDAKATRNFVDFACYVTMFPQLVAGPIVRYPTVEAALQKRGIDLEDAASGVERLVIGLGKKVLIADTLSIPADSIFGLPAGELTASLAWLGVLCYSLQIYFDFSGYSDMAIGMGRLFGFRFPENFDFPYTARSLREFWRRWHISLSTWFRDYLYIPLGGDRASRARTYRNLAIVTLVCGLWHGASWTFAIWGLFHGLWLILERAGLSRLLESLWRPFQHLYAVFVIMCGWVIFRAEDFGHMRVYFESLFGFSAAEPGIGSVWIHLSNDVLLALAAGVCLSMPVSRALEGVRSRLTAPARGPRAIASEAGYQLAMSAVLASIMLVSAMSLAGRTHNPFLYFRF